jgi:hypothetical protein
MSNWVKTDSPNCETENANRILQTGSLTVPADRYTIDFKRHLLYCNAWKVETN